jgi:hypothetical protein
MHVLFKDDYKGKHTLCYSCAFMDCTLQHVHLIDDNQLNIIDKFFLHVLHK